MLVTQAVVSDSGAAVGSATGPSRFGDGVLNRAVAQPASIAPIQAAFPGLKQLIKAGDHGVLLLTGLLSVMEVQVVAAQMGGVRKHNAFTGREEN